MRTIIKKGDKYGMLTAIKFSHRDRYGYQHWLFLCECGTEKVANVGSVKNRHTKSCGCLGMGFKKGYTPWNKGKILHKNGKYFKCDICNKKIYRPLCEIKKEKSYFCSPECRKKSIKIKTKISNAHKGKVLSEKTKSKLRKYKGNRHSQWKGGKPKCPECGKEINYKSKRCTKCWGINKRGLILSVNHRQKISNKLIGKMPKNMMRSGKSKFGNVKRGWYLIGNKKMFFRSMWEVNYALYLNFLVKQKQIKKWEYEKDVFVFEKIKFGTRSYRPDFKITNNNNEIEYHEVKGWMDAKSKTKLKRMSKYFPEIKLIIIDRKPYTDIKNKLGKILCFY